VGASGRLGTQSVLGMKNASQVVGAMVRGAWLNPEARQGQSSGDFWRLCRAPQMG
jgi:hypothetical protein